MKLLESFKSMKVTGAGSDELFLSLASNCPALNSLCASYSQKGTNTWNSQKGTSTSNSQKGKQKNYKNVYKHMIFTKR